MQIKKPNLRPFRPRRPSRVLAALFLWASAAAAVPPETLVLDVDYDPAGRPATITYPSGRSAEYTYNEGDGQKTARFAGADVVTGVEFDVHGRPVRIPYAALGDTAGGEETRSHDALGRLQSQSLWLDGASTPTYDASLFTFDARGFLTGYRRDDAGRTTDFAYDYDGQGRLTGWWLNSSRVGYTWDDGGNLLHRDAFVGEGVDLPTGGGPSNVLNRRGDWTYDMDGRLVEDGEHRYHYNAAGRLAAVFTLDGDLVAHYLYDEAGRRVRTVDDREVTFFQRGPSGGVVWQKTVALETGTAEVEEHVMLNGKAVASVTGQTFFNREWELRLTDRLGNPVVRWDGSGTHYQDYAPFGGRARAGAADDPGPHGFTGHDDDATGHVYMLARYYDPDHARFQRPDPARDFDFALPSSLNLYQYGRNNPIEYVDPTGLAGLKVEIGAGIPTKKVTLSIEIHDNGNFSVALKYHSVLTTAELIPGSANVTAGFNTEGEFQEAGINGGGRVAQAEVVYIHAESAQQGRTVVFMNEQPVVRGVIPGVKAGTDGTVKFSAGTDLLAAGVEAETTVVGYKSNIFRDFADGANKFLEGLKKILDVEVTPGSEESLKKK